MPLNLVYYSQEDPRWKNVMYSSIKDKSQTIGLAGCGPTSFAMVASSFLGRTILPTETAKFSVDNGHRTPDSGTAWSLFPDIAEAYGINCKISGSLEEVKKALAGGALVIASMKSGGHFTRGGHFIALVGASGGAIDVFDPNPDNTNYGSDGLIDQGVKNDGRVRAKEIVLTREARQYWIFTMPVKPAAPAPKKEGPTLDAKVANDLIARYMKPAYEAAAARKDEAGKKQAAADADALRVASGQQKQNS